MYQPWFWCKFERQVLNFPFVNVINSELIIGFPITKFNYISISKNRSWHELTSKEQNNLLLQALGPQTKYGIKKVLIPTVFYSTVSFLGFPGNVLTCLIIWKNSYMKTAANWLIFNLAITDLVTLLLGIRSIFVT